MIKLHQWTVPVESEVGYNSVTSFSVCKDKDAATALTTYLNIHIHHHIIDVLWILHRM